MNNPAGNRLNPVETLFRASGPPSRPEEPLRLCRVCGRAIGAREKRICVLSAPGGLICSGCREDYALRHATRGALLDYVGGRLDLLGRDDLLRLAFRIAGADPFLDWFYSGGYLETEGEPP